MTSVTWILRILTILRIVQVIRSKIRKEIMKFCFNKVRMFMDKTLLRDLSINLFV